LPDRNFGNWQEKLTHAFFDSHSDVSVIFFTDDDELRELAPDSPDAAADLAAAVAELVDPRRKAGMFDAAADVASRWRAGSRHKPPPTLPILALSVLAATRMRTDSQGMSHNYYLRLAQVLLTGGGGEPMSSKPG
jgi:hypothetical protein